MKRANGGSLLFRGNQGKGGEKQIRALWGGAYFQIQEVIARLKAEAHQAFITEVTQKGDFIKLVMYEKTQADPKKIEQMVQKYQGKMKFVIDTRPYFLYTKPRKSAKDNKDVLELTREMIEDIAGIS